MADAEAFGLFVTLIGGLDREPIHRFAEALQFGLCLLVFLLGQCPLGQTRHVFVDEYQDTNYLQELIYFAIAKACIAKGGSFVVVGDDDQALYRFRGATVELFADFAKRIPQGITVKPIPLSRNYRSTAAIVEFYNAFAVLDGKYQAARVSGKMPTLAARKPDYTPYPVLGMFRNDVHDLADDLAKLTRPIARLLLRTTRRSPHRPYQVAIAKRWPRRRAARQEVGRA